MSTSEQWILKDAEFARLLRSGEFPCKSCADCYRGACCKRYWHHIGDCCTHCGNDERTIGGHNSRDD